MWQLENVKYCGGDRRSSGASLAENMSIALDTRHLLPRGSSVRNTQSVYGIVLYTGMETKVMQNSQHAPSKRSVGPATTLGY